MINAKPAYTQDEAVNSAALAAMCFVFPMFGYDI